MPPARPSEQWVTDHIVPASEGGASTRDNLQLAHYACNLRRGAQLGAKRAAGTAPGEGASFDVIPHPDETEGVSNMFGLKKKGPSRPTETFAHAVGCTIVTADPGFQPEWQEIEEGHWRRICQCWSEDIYEPRVDTRTRLDPLDPATFRHGPSCEHRDVADPGIVRAILRVYDRERYWWVECLTCAYGWQTPHYAAESVG